MKIHMIDHLPIVSINIEYNGKSKKFNHVLLDIGCSSTILDTDLSEEIGLLRFSSMNRTIKYDYRSQ